MPEIEQRRQIDGDSSARIDCILPPPLPREGKEQEAKPMPHSLLAKAMVDAAFTEDPNWAKYQPKILKKALEKVLEEAKQEARAARDAASGNSDLSEAPK